MPASIGNFNLVRLLLLLFPFRPMKTFLIRAEAAVGRVVFLTLHPIPQNLRPLTNAHFRLRRICPTKQKTWKNAFFETTERFHLPGHLNFCSSRWKMRREADATRANNETRASCRLNFSIHLPRSTASMCSRAFKFFFLFGTIMTEVTRVRLRLSLSNRRKYREKLFSENAHTLHSSSGDYATQ